MIKDTIKTILKAFLIDAGIILVGSSIAYRFGIDIKQKEVLFFTLFILIMLSILEILVSNILIFIKKNNTDIDERIINMLKEIDFKKEEIYIILDIIWYMVIVSILIFVTIPNFIMLGLLMMLIANSVSISILLVTVYLFQHLIKENAKI
jgi:hypothetical protein